MGIFLSFLLVLILFSPVSAECSCSHGQSQSLTRQQAHGRCHCILNIQKRLLNLILDCLIKCTCHWKNLPHSSDGHSSYLHQHPFNEITIQIYIIKYLPCILGFLHCLTLSFSTSCCGLWCKHNHQGCGREESTLLRRS